MRPNCAASSPKCTPNNRQHTAMTAQTAHSDSATRAGVPACAQPGTLPSHSWQAPPAEGRCGKRPLPPPQAHPTIRGEPGQSPRRPVSNHPSPATNPPRQSALTPHFSPLTPSSPPPPGSKCNSKRPPTNPRPQRRRSPRKTTAIPSSRRRPDSPPNGASSKPKRGDLTQPSRKTRCGWDAGHDRTIAPSTRAHPSPLTTQLASATI